MAENLTPMMQQYQRIKREIPSDALLLFRLGDFYELFFDDAKLASGLLGLTLTNRNGSPMCGIPHHASESYIGRLLKAGRKVAVCDQLEEAGAAKGIIKRDVTQIVTPGTVFADRFLKADVNNFLAAISTAEGRFGLAFLDVTTGDFKLSELETPEALTSELLRLHPAEIVIPAECQEIFTRINNQGWTISFHEPWHFEYETAYLTLKDHFKTQSLDGFGCQGMSLGVAAAGGALHYVQNHLRRSLAHVHRLHTYDPSHSLALDRVTHRNLDLTEQGPAVQRAHTLLGALDRTVTSMGARLMREWVTRPLRHAQQILDRQQVIREFSDEADLHFHAREVLKEVKDLERIMARLSTNNGNARDLLGLKCSLQRLPEARECFGKMRSPLAVEERARIGIFDELAALLERAIHEEAPLALKEGGIIKDAYSSELDELRAAARSGKEWIAQLQQREIERTGISSLKIRFTSVFGYFIEVTKSNLSKVPAEYHRKQTIATGERFITPELKDMEAKILGSEERMIKLEYDLFLQVRDEVMKHSAAIQQTASAIAAFDALAGLAWIARERSYVCPEINEGGIIEILEGRHPVLEQIMDTDATVTAARGGFVPNDVKLGGDSQIIIITGPNMAGKSTYIRQVALLTLMAHIGSWVPAKKANVCLVDRIFTRVGANDDLARGQSTFMVEMNETANILNNATADSLVILDEIGRGTSTYDGISIAWAVVEHLHDRLKAKTLFATHYHELTQMARRLARIRNFNVAVREWNDQIIFLRKIVEGSSDRSYGIQVGRLAGLPREVIDRAKEILNKLESSDTEADWEKDGADGQTERRVRRRKIKPDMQMTLFGKPEEVKG
jgi:DNA mismatch repair protein MutS